MPYSKAVSQALSELEGNGMSFPKCRRLAPGRARRGEATPRHAFAQLKTPPSTPKHCRLRKAQSSRGNQWNRKMPRTMQIQIINCSIYKVIAFGGIPRHAVTISAVPSIFGLNHGHCRRWPRPRSWRQPSGSLGDGSRRLSGHWPRLSVHGSASPSRTADRVPASPVPLVDARSDGPCREPAFTRS